MQGSGVTQSVRFLANETLLLVISGQSPGEKSIDNTTALVLRSHKFSCVFFIFIGNIWLFWVFVICKKQVCCGCTCRRLVDPQHFDNVIHDIILSSIRGQTIKNWHQFAKLGIHVHVTSLWQLTPKNPSSFCNHKTKFQAMLASKVKNT